jgi:hypothetical protein
MRINTAFTSKLHSMIYLFSSSLFIREKDGDSIAEAMLYLPFLSIYFRRCRRDAGVPGKKPSGIRREPELTGNKHRVTVRLPEAGPGPAALVRGEQTILRLQVPEALSFVSEYALVRIRE